MMTGYPNHQTFFHNIDLLVNAGAQMLELQIPFSDPMADGPVLTAVNDEMIKNGATVNGSLDLIAEVKKRHPQIQICVMSYLNPVYKYGYELFADKLNQIGVSSLLLPDLPVQEIANFPAHTTLQRTMIVSDNLDDDTIKNIAAHTTGFLYVLAAIGTTGLDISDKQKNLTDFVVRLRSLVGSEKKLIVGFGIKSRSDIEFLEKIDVDGFIIGTEIIKQVQAGSLESYLEEIVG